MIETDAHRRTKASPQNRRPAPDYLETSPLSVGRVTKGVAAALGRTLSIDYETALPDRLASLIERLHEGPLGQTHLKPRRVA